MTSIDIKRAISICDGYFDRYDSLLQSGKTDEELRAMGLLRVHPDFRVVALGLPVPAFTGFPLDPPLRSRFQGLFVAPPSLGVQRHILEDILLRSTGGGNPHNQSAAREFAAKFSRFTAGVRALSKQGSTSTDTRSASRPAAKHQTKLPFLTEEVRIA